MRKSPPPHSPVAGRPPRRTSSPKCRSLRDGSSKQGGASRATTQGNNGKHGLRLMERSMHLRRAQRPQASSMHETLAGCVLARLGRAWQF
eukprot:11156622-Lingulodinium_polyedra.AAC.1